MGRGARCIFAGLLATTPLSAASARYDSRPCFDCDIPWAWEDGASPPPSPPIYPEGFALTVLVGPDRPGPVPAVLNRYREVADALGLCWGAGRGLGNWGAATLRVSFKRDGTVNGMPRVLGIAPIAGGPAPGEIRSALLSALSHCTPLHFSPSLGQAVAGQIFAIRFIQEGHP